MEILYIILAFIFGGLLVYSITKSSTISRNVYDELNQNFIYINADFKNAEHKIEELQFQLKNFQNLELNLNNKLNNLQQEVSTLLANNEMQTQQIQKQNDFENELNEELKNLRSQNQSLIEAKSNLTANNENLISKLATYKEEVLAMQETAKTEFKNIANSILEEKTEKFTLQNQTNLKTILDPFQEKITELKNRVNETYDKESKERFSLAEKVKELAELNQQISDDAKKLTRALKGESKTQGNWGEMILESILEKSGLVKGREYFLEHELKDEDNKALFSEFNGKKMRPDAVVKYPDERNVIIDSKTSLVAFTELVDETNPDIHAIKLSQHLSSIKNHITELSKKAYDDYGKSLDFVMMFIPSEPAYIAAMQADQHLWNFAYDRRILLLNPSNLITSLKLISDLWKREYQNRNSLEIAERGAKLYDKFVSFVESLEKIGKNIDQAKNSYTEAHKQLYFGNDNLILQTQKLKKLGLKNKKNLPTTLVENASNTIENNDD